MKGLATIAILCLWADLALAGKMYFTDRGASLVRTANLDGTDLQTLIPAAGSNIRGIAIDTASDDLFYADNGANIIYRARLDGSGREAIVSTGLDFPADLVVEPNAEKIYWCDRNSNRIERADYDGTMRETVIATAAPYYLDVDPDNGKLYWGDFSGGNIFRADLADGANVETLVSTNIQTRGVKVDVYGGYFYWCDRESHKVQRRLIDGGDIEDLYTGLDTPHGMTLDIAAGKVYWVDTGTNGVAGSTGAQAINRGDMDGSGPHEVLAAVTQPWDITINTPPANYADWVHGRFPKGVDPSISAPDADPENDGLKNLVEYYTGGHPLAATNNPPLGISGGAGQIPRMSYSFALPLRTDVSATLEVSNNARTWTSDPASIQVDLAAIGPYNGIQHFHVIGAGHDPHGTFVRLKVEFIDP